MTRFAVAASAACIWACSNATRDGVAPDAGGDSASTPMGDIDAEETLFTLAQSSSPTAIAVDSMHVYFTSCAPGGSGGSALSVPLGGGLPVTLASGPGCPVGLAVDAASLYLAGLDGGDVAKVPLGGGVATTIASSADPPIGLAVDAVSVYWTTAGGAVMKAPIGGGTPTVLASGQKSCTRPVVDAATASVYWADTNAGTIQRVALDGGAAAVVTSASTVTDLAIAGPDVVFANGYTLMKAPLGGGSPMVLGTAAGAPLLDVAVDDANVYFTSYSTIWKAALAGGQGNTIASNQAAPSAIAVDRTSVYWANGTGGQIVRLTPK